MLFLVKSVREHHRKTLTVWNETKDNNDDDDIVDITNDKWIETIWHNNCHWR